MGDERREKQGAPSQHLPSLRSEGSHRRLSELGGELELSRRSKSRLLPGNGEREREEGRGVKRKSASFKLSSSSRLLLESTSTQTHQEDLPRRMLHLQTQHVDFQRDEGEVKLLDENVSEHSLLLQNSSAELRRSWNEEQCVGMRWGRWKSSVSLDLI